MLAEHPERVIAAVRAIATAPPGCVLFHCASGKDRTGLLALVLLALAGATPDEIIADYLPSRDRLKPRYDEMSVHYQLTAVQKCLADHGTTIEASQPPDEQWTRTRHPRIGCAVLRDGPRIKLG
jgi:protein-tyrosine phosphatase